MNIENGGEMRKVLREIRKMPYYQNYAATSGAVHNIAKHEDAIEDRLVANGFTEHYPRTGRKKSAAISKETRDDWLEKPGKCSIPAGTYIAQPCGTHDSPDFIVKDFNGKVYFLECKSVKGGTPMYNSGVPKSNYIYILASKKYDQTTIFRGEDVLPLAARELIHKHIAEARERDADLEERLRSLNTSHGVTYYTRPMIQHKGGRPAGTDYFLNENRSKYEQNVLESCK